MKFLMTKCLPWTNIIYNSKPSIYQLAQMLCNTGIHSSLERYNFTHSSNNTYVNKIEEAAALIKKGSSILLMTGAGLSTPSGVPDFRSPDTGLYANLQNYKLPYPEAIFDIDYFMMDPIPFFNLAQDLYPGVHYKPNAGHFFIYLLHREGKLQKLYTQNIDGLEKIAGIPDDKLVECHGTFSSASCTLCGKAHDATEVKSAILNGKVPIVCSKGGCRGKVKPDIVFFGENLPQKFWDFKLDLMSTDILIVIGTSLEVYPFASIADAVRFDVPRILMNYNVVGSFGDRSSDVICTGNLIDIVHCLTKALNWDDKLKFLTDSAE